MFRHSLFFLLLIFASLEATAQTFRFALLADTHLSATDTASIADFQTAIYNLNQCQDIDFVLIAGDISLQGDLPSLRLAKLFLDSLSMPYYPLPGNHDTYKDSSCLTNFATIFGHDRFFFEHKHCIFAGLNSGMVGRGNGHLTTADVQWLSSKLDSLEQPLPIFVCLHHPLQSGDTDNWSLLTNMLKKHHTQAVLCGHYHRNALLNFDGLCGIVGCAAQRSHGNAGGSYTLVQVNKNNLQIFEKQPNETPWLWAEMDISAQNN